MKFSFVADRFQYLASSGPIALAAAGMVAGRRRMPAWSIPAPVHWSPLAMLIVLLSLLTWRQAALYKSRETLFRDNLAKNDQAWLADYHVGYALSRAKNYDEAIEYYKRAITLNPAYADAYGSLGLAQLKLGKTEEAVSNMRRAIELKPGKVDSLNNLGIVSFQQGRLDEAVDYFQRAISIMPNSVEALDNLAFIYLKQGKGDEAHALLLKALACRPDDPRAAEYLKMLEPIR
ncbi:tetratricopeptide repeat protein [Candidatus Sumerlaeota bacterium]|nr:tetratricopeptide repeat protein [Candidatus Sumerlaeota bacterium]